MKKTSVVVALIVALLTAAAPVSAAIHVFEPDPADLYGLDHANYVEWGLNLGTGWEFDDVVLTFKNIRNWNADPNSLFIHMLDYAAPGVMLGDDNIWAIQDYFGGQGVLIDAWSDIDPTETGVNLSYSFKDLGFLDDFSAYVANDGIVGFGFDPDCHFWNDGVQLTVIGTSIPEPGTMALFALGMVGGVAAYRRRKQ